jgi:hypothetical protein
MSSQGNTPPLAVSVTHLFALASLVLSSTIVSGPWSSLLEIREIIDKTVDILRDWPRAITLQGLVWPLCVIGCMAEPKHQAFFESLLAIFVKECGGFGNGATVLNIVKEYWKSREEKRAERRAFEIPDRRSRFVDMTVVKRQFLSALKSSRCRLTLREGEYSMRR